MNSAQQTAIVTGASRGIGAAIARRLAAEDFAVIVNYASSEDAANAVVAEIEKTGGRARAVQGDVAVASDVAALFDSAEQAFGPVSVLVNNAGRAIRKPLVDFTEEEFDSIVATNLKGSFLALAEAARRLADGGSIVNISASFQGAPIPGYGPYAASKMAIETLTEVAAKELGQRGVRVNAVRPGPTNTDLFNQGKSDEIKQKFAEQHALGRIGEPEDVANVVAFLVGERGAWVSGQSVGANGGFW